MRIEILGSGLMGGKLETLARKAGDRARTGTARDAAQKSDILLLAAHWSRIDNVLSLTGPLEGKVILSGGLRGAR